MERIDGAMERRVWERVAAVSPGREDLRPMMQEAMALAAAYRALAFRASGRMRQTLLRLHRGEWENLSCLRGLQRLRFGSCPALKALPPEPGELGRVLEKCWHRSHRAAAEYAARMAEPDSGAVFAEMSRREQTHLVLLSALLGERPG